MGPFAVDTNVPVVANQRNADVPMVCTQAAQDFLSALIAGTGERILLDSVGFILQEYMRQLSLSGQPGLGDTFMKWIHTHQANASICVQVPVTPLDDLGCEFAEFPAASELAGFDLADRKFATVVGACGLTSACVVHASDRGWWDFEQALAGCGIPVVHLCERVDRTTAG